MTNDLAARLEEAKCITKRLAAEGHTARRSWTLFEGLNGTNINHRAALHREINKLALGGPMQGIVDVLVRDTLLALFRMTDPPGQKSERLTLCRLSQLLAEQDLRSDRETEARGWIAGDAAMAIKAMNFITDLVPPSWTKAPTDPRLFNLRENLKPLRDSMLAHALDTSGTTPPIVNEVRELLELVSAAVQNAQLVFLGSAASWENDYKGRLKETTELWDLFQAGLPQ
jgi:hypothetical protein